MKRYDCCKGCRFYNGKRCVRSGPTTDLIHMARKSILKSKKCKSFKLNLRRR